MTRKVKAEHCRFRRKHPIAEWDNRNKRAICATCKKPIDPPRITPLAKKKGKAK